MFTPFILFLGLTVATAVIAHWSDNLGKKLGKKRVSLFGLRPRTTATILTVASSWGIMLFTLVALLGAVKPLRRSLFFYDRDISNAKRELSGAQEKLSGAQNSLSQTQNSLSNTRNQLSGLRASLYSTNQKFNLAQKATDAAQKAASSSQKAVDAAQKRLNLAQKRLDRARKGETAARAGESAAQGETSRAQSETSVARRLRDAAAIELKKSLANLKGAKFQLKTTQSNLKTTQGNLKTTQGTLKTTKQLAFAATTAAFAASRANFAAEKTLSQTKKQIKSLEAQRDALQNLASATLSSDAPIKVRQAFAARVIPANQAPGVIAAQLRAMLKQGQQSFAESEDITPTFPPDAKLQLLPLTVPDASGKPALLEGERLLQRLARDIAASKQTTSIRLVAPRNYLASEKLIETVFVAVPIAPAFTSGEILASTTIDGAQGDARIFHSLLDLTDLGRREAEKRGVNPPQSPDEPSFYADGTNDRLFAALRFIENSKARLRVNLVAAKELSTVEPLQVRFEIESGVVSAPNS